MYHRVAQRVSLPNRYNMAISIEDFAAQMRYLKVNGYRTITFDDLEQQLEAGEQPSRKQALITFDDGYIDTYKHAFPILQQHGFTATVFLVSSQVGGVNAWDCDRFERIPLVGMDEIREMQRAGISFGSHSVTHPRMRRLSPKEARREIVDSRAALQDMLGTPVRFFSFPYGDTNAALQEMVWEAGYLAACGIDQPRHSLYDISRIDAAGCSGADLKWRLKLRGASFYLRSHPLVQRFKGLRKPFTRASNGLPGGVAPPCEDDTSHVAGRPDGSIGPERADGTNR
jgi:peptidoglycan/xylan/chitin deacetylase (PgdA/CDA1 family)